jgi:hypothetical protein
MRVLLDTRSRRNHTGVCQIGTASLSCGKGLRFALIKLKPQIVPSEVKRKIEEAFKRNAAIDASRIKVEATGAMLRSRDPSDPGWSDRRP